MSLIASGHSVHGFELLGRAFWQCEGIQRKISGSSPEGSVKCDILHLTV